MKKIVFLGTPELSVDFLKHLIENSFNVSAVITQTDKPYGRKKVLTPPPVKSYAIKMGIPVFQPEKSLEIADLISNIKPDYAVVIAYGKIIPKSALDLVPSGFYNIHFSLLPKYRGADPVRRAILNGERETGITIFKITEHLDSGPILLSEKMIIDNNETSTDLFKRMIICGKNLMIKACKLIESENINLIPQEGEPSYAYKISVDDTYIDFSMPAEIVFRKIRAFSYDPYSRFIFKKNNNEISIQIICASIIEDNSSFLPYQISGFEKKSGIFVKCSKGSIFLKMIKPQGRTILNAYDYFINGMKMKTGDFIYEK